MIEESYKVLANWDFNKSKAENLDHLKTSNFIGAPSQLWLQDVVRAVNLRFDPTGRDLALTNLAKSGCNIEEWKPLLLWHITHREPLLNDFLKYWLFPTFYNSDLYQVQYDDLRGYLIRIGKQCGRKGKPWAIQTIYRLASGFLRISADFGLLKGSSRRDFASYQLPERSFIYLLHVLLDKYKNPQKIITALDWRIFLLCPNDIERELLRLHQAKTLTYEIIDGEAHLTLPCSSAEAYAKKMGTVTPAQRCEVGYAPGKIEWLNSKTGHVRQAYLFLGVLEFSQLIFARASDDKKEITWQRALIKMFDSFGGAPAITARGDIKKKIVSANTSSDLTEGPEIIGPYQTTVVHLGAEKLKDSSLFNDSVRIVLRTFNFIYRRHTFTSIAEINGALSHIVERINRKNYGSRKVSRFELWSKEEKSALAPLPKVPLEGVQWKSGRVHPDCTVGLRSCYYSVPHKYRGKDAQVKLTAIHVEIFIDHECVAIHERDFRHHSVRHVIAEHLPDNLQAYQEPYAQSLLSQARLTSSSLYNFIEELFAKDTLTHLRRASRLIQRARFEIKKYGYEHAEARIHEAIEQMRQNNDWRVYYFEEVLKGLDQVSKRSLREEVVNSLTSS